jgi:cell division protein FtsL
MPASKVEFIQTNALRLKAVLGLGFADIFLIHDKWLMFFILIVLAIIFEVLHLRLYEVLLHNHEVTERNRKIEERKASQQALNDMRREQGLKV